MEDVVEQFRNNQDQLLLNDREKIAKRIAARTAIQYGDSLDPKEMRSLIDRLFSCETPNVSPDGRPTMTNVSLDELQNYFGR